MIKKLFILAVVLNLFSCSRKEATETIANENRVEISPFKINKILLRDTQLIKTIYALADSGNMSISEYMWNWDRDYRYLDNTQFSAFRKAVWALVQNPESKVYLNPSDKVLTHQQLRDRIFKCDSVTESSFDKNGDEIISAKFMCDSTSVVYNINQIRFFESWYFNPSTNMIERELLGYSVHEFVSEKKAFRELFNVFVNDAALEKARKYYFNKQAQ